MKITDFLDAGRIIPEIKGGDKRAVLAELAEALAASHPSIDAKKLLEVLLEREKISSTAIGEGVAIPHGKMAEVDKVCGVFARSRRGVDFKSLDGGATHLFFLLVAPEDSAADHLKALARISRLLKDSAFRARLLEEKSAEEIFNVIRQEDQKF